MCAGPTHILRQPTFPVLKSLRNTMIFHLGSVAFGAFIIAIIQFVRVSSVVF